MCDSSVLFLAAGKKKGIILCSHTISDNPGVGFAYPSSGRGRGHISRVRFTVTVITARGVVIVSGSCNGCCRRSCPLPHTRPPVFFVTLTVVVITAAVFIVVFPASRLSPGLSQQIVAGRVSRGGGHGTSEAGLAIGLH